MAKLTEQRAVGQAVATALSRYRGAFAAAVLVCATLACAVEVPGGDFPPVTPTPSAPTPTPLIIKAVLSTPTALPAMVTPAGTVARTEPAAPMPSAVPTPSRGQAQEPVPAGAADDMVLIPAGMFVMGDDQGMPDERPAHEVELPAYSIDRFEVTNTRFAEFTQSADYRTAAEQSGSPKTWRDEWGAGEDDHPVVRVAWPDAVAYCAWAGKRLPTEAEWEKAARGPEGFLYPWGNVYDATRVNGRDGGRRGTAPVSSYKEGVSAYGLYHMAGNVREWTADEAFLPYPGNTKPVAGSGDTQRILRGGGWFDSEGDLRTVRRNATSPLAANWDVGFRCAR